MYDNGTRRNYSDLLLLIVSTGPEGQLNLASPIVNGE
jgi:hypothetical protein